MESIHWKQVSESHGSLVKMFGVVKNHSNGITLPQAASSIMKEPRTKTFKMLGDISSGITYGLDWTDQHAKALENNDYTITGYIKHRTGVSLQYLIGAGDVLNEATTGTLQMVILPEQTVAGLQQTVAVYRNDPDAFWEATGQALQRYKESIKNRFPRSRQSGHRNCC